MLKTICKSNIVVILLAIILNSNVFRFFGWSDNLMYSIYVLTFFVLCGRFFQVLKIFVTRYPIFRLFFLSSFFLLLYAFLSSILHLSLDNIFLSGKLLLTFLIFSFIPVMTSQEVLRVIVLSIIINIVYCFAFFLNPSRYDTFIDGSLTYLNSALSIGFSLTLSFVLFIYSFIRKKYIISILSSIGVLLFLFSLLQLPARGSLLFPPLAALLLMPFMIGRNRFKGIVLIAFFAVAFSSVSAYFLKNGSEYAVRHMMNLFENAEEESRVSIWKRCIDLIFSNGWYVLGGGVGCFVREKGTYPHNLFLQVIGEFGILGIAWLYYFMFISYRVFKNIVSNKNLNNRGLSFCILGAYIYYFLCFMKSFQIYEVLPLLILFAFSIVLSGKYNFKREGVIIPNR